MNKVEKFISQHKDYFRRNEQLLQTNEWHKEKAKKTKTAKDSDEEVRKSKSRKEYLETDNKLVKNMLNRLSAFIKVSEGDRHIPKVQKFIDDTVKIIFIFINKCDEYIEKNDVTKIKNIDIRNAEIELQDLIFNHKIKAQDTLDSLDINSEVDNLQVKFYSDAKASLILKEPLSLKNFDIGNKIETLPVSWDVCSSKELYINMRPQDIPKWNPKKHFFDQDQVVLQFWIEEYNKIKRGININGYFMHPWLYFHLNFYKTPIPQKDGSEPTINPYLRDNEWFFVENLKAAANPDNPDYFSKIILAFGTRRFSKSVILSSLAHWKILTKANAFGTIVGGSSSDLNSLTSKVKTSLDHIVPAFKLDTLQQNWDNGETSFGIKDTNTKSTHFSSLIVQNIEGGAKKSSQKTAGLAPSVSIWDEIGKVAFLAALTAAMPSFATEFGYKAPVILAGTSGESDLSNDAMEVLSNPELFNVLLMDWDLLESKIDPEYVTWKRRTFGTFFPGQMAYEKGFVKKDVKFSEFLGVKGKELENINIKVTDWKKNTEFLQEEINKIKTAKSSKAKFLEQQRKLQYPLDPEDCFMSVENNPFDAPAAKAHKEYLQEIGAFDVGLGRKVFLDVHKETGRIVEIDAKEAPLPDFPFKGGFIDSPVVLYDEIPLHQPEPHEYIAGLDDYKQEVSDGDSVGSLTIYKRGIGEKSLTIVAEYNARPDPHKKFHRQVYLLLKAFNAKCFMENEDMGLKYFLDTKNEAYRWLYEAVDFSSELQFKFGGNRKYGWQPNSANISFMMTRLIEYCEEPIELENEQGEVYHVLGLTRIPSIGILNEIINFKKDGNFDRLRSFGSCLMYSHYLDKTLGKPQDNTRLHSENKKKKRPTTRSDYFFGTNNKWF